MSGRDVIDDSDRLRKAVHEALKTLGDDGSIALMFHLKKRVPGLEQGRVTIEELESALTDLLGSGAQILLEDVRQRLRKH